MYFLETGLVRGYTLLHGREVSSWFMQAGTFLISIISFLTQQPSEEHLELLEPTVALSITYDQLQELYCDFPEFNHTDRLLIEKYYVLSGGQNDNYQEIDRAGARLLRHSFTPENFIMLFYLTNVRTPRLMGYVFQRPEMHRIHH